MFTCTLVPADSPARRVLTLVGELTVKAANDLRLSFMEALDRAESVALHLGGVTVIDVSCMQILCAATRSAVSRDVGLAVATGFPAEVARQVEEAGFSRSANCRCSAIGGGSCCIWASSTPLEMAA